MATDTRKPRPPAPVRRDRKPLTDVTWDIFGGMYLNQHLWETTRQERLTAGKEWGWPVLSDLAHQLHAKHPHLDFDTCQVLVDGATNGLAVVLTLANGKREVGVIDHMSHHANSTVALRQWGWTSRPRLCEIAEARTAQSLIEGGI